MKSSELSKEQIKQRQVRQWERERKAARRKDSLSRFWAGYLKALVFLAQVTSWILLLLLTIVAAFVTVVFGIAYPVITLSWWAFFLLPIGIAITVLLGQSVKFAWHAYGWI